MMPSNERIFVQAIRSYCARHGIAIDVRADGWLIAMDRDETRRFAFGYDIGLNSAIAHRLANDKAATAEVLALTGVPCIPHQLFLDPKMGEHIAGPGQREAMLALLAQNPLGVVVKPNEGTAGRSVFKVTSRADLERAIGEVFSTSLGLAITPYVEIEDEVRVILLDETPMAVYGKERPSVVGDGVRTLRELVSAVPRARLGDIDELALCVIVPKGERLVGPRVGTPAAQGAEHERGEAAGHQRGEDPTAGTVEAADREREHQPEQERP